jgi:hypothetical protein
MYTCTKELVVEIRIMVKSSLDEYMDPDYLILYYIIIIFLLQNASIV